jgi:hypothetical protein
MNRNLCEPSDEVDRIGEAIEGQTGGDTLGIQIESKSNEINVSRALSVSKEAAVDTLRTSKQRQLRCSDSRTWWGDQSNFS